MQDDGFLAGTRGSWWQPQKIATDTAFIAGPQSIMANAGATAATAVFDGAVIEPWTRLEAPATSEVASDDGIGPRFMWGVSLGMLALHVTMLGMASWLRSVPWSKELVHLDAEWYARIAERGYFENAWAFFPLYPMLIRGLKFLLPGLAPPQVLGAVLSVGFTLAFTALVVYWQRSDDERLAALKPRNRYAWLLLNASPAAYIFHTCHTEALFMLLTGVAFTLAAKQRWLSAALVAGLCALTRNQGVVVAVCVALWLAGQQTTPRRKLGAVLKSGTVSGAIFGLYLLYQYAVTGDLLAFMHAQYHWRPEMSVASYLRTFWFGNPWQSQDQLSIIRHVYFACLLWALARAVVLCRNLPLLLFVGICVAMIPISGEFRTALRYSAILFPLFFSLGSDLTAGPKRRSHVIVLLIFIGHLITTQQYLLGHWSY